MKYKLNVALPVTANMYCENPKHNKESTWEEEGYSTCENDNAECVSSLLPQKSYIENVANKFSDYLFEVNEDVSNVKIDFDYLVEVEIIVDVVDRHSKCVDIEDCCFLKGKLWAYVYGVEDYLEDFCADLVEGKKLNCKPYEILGVELIEEEVSK